MSKRVPSQNQGARDERRDWVAKIRRMLKHCHPSSDAVLEELLEWGQLRAKRTAKRKGGLGRK